MNSGSGSRSPDRDTSMKRILFRPEFSRAGGWGGIGARRIESPPFYILPVLRDEE
jgi:hypothetical protein